MHNQIIKMKAHESLLLIIAVILLNKSPVKFHYPSETNKRRQWKENEHHTTV